MGPRGGNLWGGPSWLRRVLVRWSGKHAAKLPPEALGGKGLRARTGLGILRVTPAGHHVQILYGLPQDCHGRLPGQPTPDHDRRRPKENRGQPQVIEDREGSLPIERVCLLSARENMFRLVSAAREHDDPSRWSDDHRREPKNIVIEYHRAARPAEVSTEGNPESVQRRSLHRPDQNSLLVGNASICEPNH